MKKLAARDFEDLLQVRGRSNYFFIYALLCIDIHGASVRFQHLKGYLMNRTIAVS